MTRFYYLIKILSKSWLTLFLLGLVPNSFAQKIDKKSQELYDGGDYQFRIGNIQRAAQLFTQVATRKFNKHTTPSIYMAGLSYLYLNDYDKAMFWFQKLVTEYAQSIYVEEAQYHKAWLMIHQTDPEIIKGGLYILTRLIEESKSQTLKTDAQSLFRNFLFNDSSTGFLESYFEHCKDQYKPTVCEALALNYYKNGDNTALKALVQKHGRDFPILTDYYKFQAVRQVINAEEKTKPVHYIQVAVLVPFFEHLADSAFQIQGVNWSIELTEGLKLAAQQLELRDDIYFNIKVFDSQKDIKVCEKIIKEEFPNLLPNIVIGDIFNNPSRVIGEAAEEQGFVQIIPVSPANDLIENRKQVFLACPSIETQVQGLCNYALNKYKFDKVAVVYDSTKTGQASADAFVEFHKKKKIPVLVKKIKAADERLLIQLVTEAVEDLKKLGCDAVYLPSYNEKFINHFLKALITANLKIQVLGTSDWTRLKNVERAFLSKFETIFPETYYIRNDTATYSNFFQKYSATFNNAPTKYSCIGFDIMNYLANLCKAYQPNLTFKELIHEAKPYRGIIQNYYFGNALDNQSVQILQFKEGKIIKLQTW